MARKLPRWHGGMLRITLRTTRAAVTVHQGALVRVEARLVTLIGEDAPGGVLTPPSRLIGGAAHAAAAVEAFGVAFHAPVTVHRIDLAAELIFASGLDGLVYLQACQRGLHLPRLKQLAHFAQGAYRLEMVEWRAGAGHTSARLYDAGQRHQTHGPGERLRFEVQERFVGRQARTPEQVTSLDPAALFGKRLRPWLAADHGAVVIAPRAAVLKVYDDARAGCIELRRAHTVASQIVKLDNGGDLLTPHERSRLTGKLREAGVALDLSGDPEAPTVDIGAPLRGLVNAWSQELV